MYRRVEFELINLLSWVSLTCVAGALIFVGIYCLQPLGPYRVLALILMLLGLFFQIQIFMYKVTVMERRMLHLVDLGEQHFKVAEKRAMVQLVIFFLLFWAALISVIFAFLL